MKQYLLAGDIGGTKTLLSLAETTSQPGTPLTQFTPLAQETYPSGDYGNFLSLVLAFLQTAQTQLGQLPPIAQACFGIAGPVVNQTSVITNLSWPPLVAEDLAQSLQIPKVLLINDFTAIGYGLLGLEK
ncbi:MAG: glucokinase, partial [Merismopediaceae bacterium]|nr:glucokinase [Merismopediaceae bacterium]